MHAILYDEGVKSLRRYPTKYCLNLTKFRRNLLKVWPTKRGQVPPLTITHWKSQKAANCRRVWSRARTRAFHTSITSSGWPCGAWTGMRTPQASPQRQRICCAHEDARFLPTTPLLSQSKTSNRRCLPSFVLLEQFSLFRLFVSFSHWKEFWRKIGNGWKRAWVAEEKVAAELNFGLACPKDKPRKYTFNHVVYNNKHINKLEPCPLFTYLFISTSRKVLFIQTVSRLNKNRRDLILKFKHGKIHTEKQTQMSWTLFCNSYHE